MAKGNFNTDELTNYYAKIYAQVEDETLNDPYGSYILQRVKGGQKTVFNKTQSEIRNFDMSFLDVIESVYPAILKIMRDPKKSIRYDSEVVQVEKAKKINSETVRHLASHTQFIKKVTEDNVIPSKVLTTFSEDELAIYENRFIKTLVRRLEQFIERRYEVMKVSLESFETEKLDVKNSFLISGQEVNVTLDIEIKNDLTADVETTKEQYNRLLGVRQDIQGLKGTEFMRALAKAKEVLPPIMKTNIILHNPDFKLCYGLWLYLDRVDSIATNVDVREKNYKYSKIFDKDINACMALALTSFIKNRNIDGIYASKKLPQVKAPKPEENKEIELDLNFDADTKKLEDYTMNEALLSQTAKFFESSLEGMQQTGNKYNESIRVVYRQMLDMLDQIYPTAFGVADDELESKDLYEQLEYARRRMMIFKIVRQSKSMNIARMGKEEKRIEKLITRLEEKIKNKEQKDREREEREREREEAKRLATIEREKKERLRKRKLEKDALDAQKAIEKFKLEQLNRANEISPEEAKRNKIMEPFVLASREYMKKLQEEQRKREEDAINGLDIQAPVRRKDEYDDMTDEELEALMASNDLFGDLDSDKDKEPAPEKKVTKKVVKKKKQPEKAPEPEIKRDPTMEEAIQNKDIEDMTAEELEALMNAQEGGFGAFDVSDTPAPAKKPAGIKKGKKNDANADLQGLSDEPKEEKPTISLKPKKKKKAEEEPKEETPVENTETSPEAPAQDTPVDNQPEEAKAEDTPVETSPEDGALPQEENPIEEAKAEDVSQEEAAQETPQEASSEDSDDSNNEDESSDNSSTPDDTTGAISPEENLDSLNDSNDELDNMSDEELEALMKENDLLEDKPADEPKEAPKAKAKPKISLKPKSKPEEKPVESKPKASSDDDLENLSDEELEALMKENDLF